MRGSVELASIGEARKKLPGAFIEDIYENFSPGTADKILSGMIVDRYTTMRVNTIKYNVYDLMSFLRSNNIKFERVPWYEDGIVLKNARERDIQNFDIYKEGFVSFQSLSSMIPTIVLNPKENERVLDMAAAPGSKTTQLAALMNNKGYILANELDKIRSERLKHKVEVMGASIVEVVTGRGEKLGESYEEAFNKVLLDTPCSGEGRFIVGEPSTTRYWSKREVEKLASLQKKLFKSGCMALKKGGIMVYSTCTLNTLENEEVLQWAIDNLDMEIIDLGIDIKGAVPGIDEDMDKSLKKAVRILPSKDMEGFFICRLRKK